MKGKTKEGSKFERKFYYDEKGPLNSEFSNLDDAIQRKDWGEVLSIVDSELPRQLEEAITVKQIDDETKEQHLSRLNRTSDDIVANMDASPERDTIMLACGKLKAKLRE